MSLVFIMQFFPDIEHIAVVLAELPVHGHFFVEFLHHKKRLVAEAVLFQKDRFLGLKRRVETFQPGAFRQDKVTERRVPALFYLVYLCGNKVNFRILLLPVGVELIRSRGKEFCASSMKC